MHNKELSCCQIHARLLTAPRIALVIRFWYILILCPVVNLHDMFNGSFPWFSRREHIDNQNGNTYANIPHWATESTEWWSCVVQLHDNVRYLGDIEHSLIKETMKDGIRKCKNKVKRISACDQNGDVFSRHSIVSRQVIGHHR